MKYHEGLLISHKKENLMEDYNTMYIILSKTLDPPANFQKIHRTYWTGLWVISKIQIVDNSTALKKPGFWTNTMKEKEKKNGVKQ